MGAKVGNDFVLATKYDRVKLPVPGNVIMTLDVITLGEDEIEL